MVQLGFKMEEMVFNMADSHFFFNDLEVSTFHLDILFTLITEFNIIDFCAGM